MKTTTYIFILSISIFMLIFIASFMSYSAERKCIDGVISASAGDVKKESLQWCKDNF